MILSLCVIGAAIVAAIRGHWTPWHLGESFLVGSGAVALVLLFTQSPLPAIGAYVAVVIVCAVVARRRWTPAVSTQSLSFIDAITLVVIAGQAIDATMVPIGGWDFWAIWGLKGRAFFDAGRLDWAFLRNPEHAFAHPEYPLLLPLNCWWDAILHQRWDDRALGLLFTAFGAAGLLVVRARLGALAALALAGAIFAFPIGYADLPLVVFALGAFVLIIEDDWPIGALLLGFAAFTKNEGVALLAATVIALLLLKRTRDVTRLWPAFAMAAIWPIVRFATDVTSRPADLVTAHGNAARFTASLARAPELFALLLHNRPWMPLLAPIAIAGVLWIIVRGPSRLVAVVVALQAVVYVAVYFASARDWNWLVPASWPRLQGHLILLGALAMLVQWPKNKLVLILLLVCGFELRYPRLVAREVLGRLHVIKPRAAVVDSARLPDRETPDYPKFLEGVRASTKPGDVIAVTADEYRFYRATYFLTGRAVTTNAAKAQYIAFWPGQPCAALWTRFGGTLCRR